MPNRKKELSTMLKAQLYHMGFDVDAYKLPRDEFDKDSKINTLVEQLKVALEAIKPVEPPEPQS